MIDGILLLYHYPPTDDANTIVENIEAFGRYSHFNVTAVNTAFGFPPSLSGLQFRIVVLHYSLFYPLSYRLHSGFLGYLERSNGSHKIAFFQDEHHYCRQRFEFINHVGVDWIYTLLEPAQFEKVYGTHTSASRLIHHLPGYVSDQMLAWAEKLTKPERDRSIDIGYRARRLPFYMGRGGQEKYDIGVEFRERAISCGLRLDIKTDEESRIYGDDWYRFVANCRAVLGVESGVSIFDVEDVVREECETLERQNPSITFEEISERLLSRWEGNIHYRTISPRHFEAAAFRVCQILFEGDYSGIMQPMIHYIPLKKDFSNFDEVIAMFRNPELRAELTENAYRDLIASGRHSYQRFIGGFDQHLLDAGFESSTPSGDVARALATLSREAAWLRLRGTAKAKLYNLVMRRQPVAFFAKPALKFVKG